MQILRTVRRSYAHYAEITQKLHKLSRNYAKKNAKNAEIMHITHHEKNANYAKITQKLRV
jgi:hypothetical protein